MPDTIPVSNFTDTYVRQDKATTVYSDSRTLQVGNPSGGTAYTYLYVNKPFPTGATILSATLRLYRSGAWTGSRTLTLRRLSEQLKATRTTWTKQPAAVSPVTYTDNGGADGSMVELDVKAAMQAVAGGAAWWGFRLESNEATRRALVSSEGTSGLRPVLLLSWAVPPTKPTGLSPAAGRAVSGAKPVLRWSAQAGTSDSTLAAVQVQVDPTGNWTTPAWSSGWVTTTDAQLDLGATTYPGLANGATAQWRVQVKDTAGLVSDWSDGASWKHQDLGVVSILNPASGSSPVVTDTTPPFLWSFAGTQVSWRAFLTDPADPLQKVLDDSGTRTTTDTSWTPKAKILTGPGPYRLTVQVWDNVAREATPLDPGLAQATRDFTVTTGATAPVTGLSVDQNKPFPTVILSWSRADAPDSYTIRRDGTVLEDLVLPGDVLVSGTSYRYEDESPRVWHPHTWQVQPVVNGVAGPSVGVSYTPTQVGIWLLDKARDRRVWIAGRDAGTWSLGEDATVFSPLGSTQSVRRVQGQRGYEGSLTGQLLDGYNRTATDYEDDLLAMRSEPGRPVVLAVADLTIRVLLGNVTTIPTVSVPPQRIASFDFWEVS